MAKMDTGDSMDEDFTGFDEEPLAVAHNPTGTAVIDGGNQVENSVEMQETDSDSGNLVIAEPHKKQAPKSVDKSPRKRRSKAEDITPTRAPSTRTRGQGLAYLIAMEKGGSKKQLAKAQSQTDVQEPVTTAPSPHEEILASPAANPEPLPDVELEKKKTPPKEKDATKPSKEKESIRTKVDEFVDLPKENEALRDIDAISSPKANVNSPVPGAVKAVKGGGARKSFSAINISSPLLKEPFKGGWRREVVYRATVDTATKTLCDVYYYTPDGKKLRSGREVSDYLEKVDSPYSSENFTFFKEPIGMDSEQEILRYAKTRRDDGGGEKLINKKEKALKAREEELRRNLQELGEDVAAITGQQAARDSETVTAIETSSPQHKKKRTGGTAAGGVGGGSGPKVEKQLKIKLWGKGLRSKENAEPPRRDGAVTEGEDESGAALTATSTVKASSPRTVPDDISHLFVPHIPAAGAVSKLAGARGATGRKGHLTGSSEAAQNLELINGKRFVSVGPNSDTVRHSPGSHSTSERVLSSPNSRHSPKRIKLSLAPPSPLAHYVSKAKSGGFCLFSNDQLNNFISHAYHGLLHVFRYLTVQELMAAAGVCKLWRDLALHHSHWRTVRLKNSRIYDWSLFASHLRRAGTQHLDMRKMFFVTSPEETWANLGRAASCLSEIRRIDLCKCPAEVLDSIAAHCLKLNRIDAQFISSSQIRLEPLRNLKELEELKIRSISSTRVDGGLEALAQLTGLKSVNLTTVSNLSSSDLIHLTELPLLECLEIGDCVHWSAASDFEALSQLVHLRHLRLENGPPDGVLRHLDLSESGMRNLQHIELINFTMDYALEALKSSGLKRLLIVPRYTAENLADTMKYTFGWVSSMPQLQQLSWVVTEETLNSSTDGRMQLETENGQTSVTVDELQDLLRQRMPQTNVEVLRLPEYASQRFGLSINQED